MTNFFIATFHFIDVKYDLFLPDETLVAMQSQINFAINNLIFIRISMH